MADEVYTPDEWAPSPIEGPHDHKGYSEEKCVRCGWVMGMTALNCMNDDTPHRFSSQEAEIERLRAELSTFTVRPDEVLVIHCPEDCDAHQLANCFNDSPLKGRVVVLKNVQARRG